MTDRNALSDEELATIIQNDEVEIYVLYVNGVRRVTPSSICAVGPR